MPKLPQPTAEGRSMVVQSPGAAPHASPWHYGSQAFGQMQQFGEQISEAANRIHDRKEELDLTKADDAYRMQMSGLLRSLATNPNTADHQRHFTEGVASAQKTVLSQFPDLSPSARQVLERRFSTHTTTAEIHAATLTQKMGVDQVLTSYDELASQHIQKAARSDDMASAADLINTVDDHRARNVAAGFMDASDAAKDARGRQDQYWKTVAQNRPDDLLFMIDKGRGHDGVMAMDPAKRQEYRNLAVNTIRLNELSSHQAEADANAMRVKLARESETKLFAIMSEHDADPAKPALRPNDPELKKLSEYDPVKALSLLGVIHARLKERERPEPVRTNPVIERHLFARIHARPGDGKLWEQRIVDETPLNAAYEHQQLSWESLQHLRSELADGSHFGKAKADFLKGFEQQITRPGPLGVFADPANGELFLRFKQDLLAEVDRMRKAGKDEWELLNPKSDAYFGRPANLKKYLSTGLRSLETPTSDTPAPSERKSLDAIFGGK